MISRTMLASLGRFLALLLVVETTMFWASSRLFLSPIQRHYLAGYLRCSLPVAARSTVEVQWIWKIGPAGNRELASENDAIPSEGGIGMDLSPSALEAGWVELREDSPQRVPTFRLKGVLADLTFDEPGFWSGVFLIGAFGFVLFYCALSGWDWLEGYLPELPWQRHRFPWENPPPSLLKRLTGRAQRIRSQLATLHKNVQPHTAAHTRAADRSTADSELRAQPKSFAIPLFGSHDGTDKDSYLWTEKDEIE